MRFIRFCASKMAGVVSASRLSLRTMATAARACGNLKDSDRIFQNLYGRHDWGLKGAIQRVSQDVCGFFFVHQFRFFSTFSRVPLACSWP